MAEEAQPLELRLGVVFASTWRIVVELMRRHDHEQEFKPYHVYPDLSPGGILYLVREIGPELGLREGIAFHLGGGAFGRAEIEVPFGSSATNQTRPAFRVQYAREMLASADQKPIVDRIGEAAGLRVPAELPITSPRVLAYRVLAALLERHALSRAQYRTSGAYFDHNGDWSIAEWAREIDSMADAARFPKQRWVEAAIQASDLWAVHPMIPNEGPCTAELPASSIIVDAQRCRAWRPGRAYQAIELMDRYNASERRVAPLVREVEALCDD